MKSVRIGSLYLLSTHNHSRAYRIQKELQRVLDKFGCDQRVNVVDKVVKNEVKGNTIAESHDQHASTAFGEPEKVDGGVSDARSGGDVDSLRD